MSQEETQPLKAGSTPSVQPKPRGDGSSGSSKTTTNASRTIQMPPVASTNNNNTATAVNSNASSQTQEYSEAVICSGFVIFVLAVYGLVSLITSIVLSSTDDDALRAPEFRVDSVFIMPFNSTNYQTSSSLSSSYNNWIMNISFVAINTKKETTLFYDMVRASLFYDKELLSVTDIGAFYQEADEQTMVNVTFKKSSDERTPVANWVGTAFDDYRKQGKALKFNVLVQARAMLNVGSLSSGEENWLTVNCRDINVQFLSDAVVQGTNKPAAAAKYSCDVLLMGQEDDSN